MLLISVVEAMGIFLLWIGAIDINWRNYRYFSIVGCGLMLLISVAEAIGIFCCELVLLISVGEL